MTKPIGYYTDKAPQLDELQNLFGDHLQHLTREDKLMLQLCLAKYVCCLDYHRRAVMRVMAEDYPFRKPSANALEVLNILDKLGQQHAQSLLVAISNQLASPS